jgi:GABA(A) receptor-associated protein
MSFFLKSNYYESLLDTKSFEERLSESDKVLKKYPERIPVIVEPLIKDIVNIDKNKFIVSKDMTFGQLIYIIRKRINIESSHALFFSVNGNLCSTGSDILSIYTDNKNNDNFLYVKYTTENTFG